MVHVSVYASVSMRLCLCTNIPCESMYRRWEMERSLVNATLLSFMSKAMPIPVAGERGDGAMDGGDEQGCHDPRLLRH